MYVEGIRQLFAFPDWVIERISLDRELAEVRLRRDRRRKLTCPDCGRRARVNRRSRQLAWDLPLGTALTVAIVYEAIQGRCPGCGHFTVRPPGIDEHARATRRLMLFVSRLARFMPLNRICEILPHVDVSTAKRWDKRMLRETLAEPNLDGIRTLLIDEKQVRRRHGYVTLVMNGQTGELLFMAEGKKKTTLEAFFDKLTDEQKASIEAVGIDRMGSYQAVVQEQLPHAQIVYDKFHIILRYHGVIDTIRRDEWRKARAEDKQAIKGQRYNLFLNPENRSPKQKRDLRSLLKMNENINTAHVLLDGLKHLWTYVYPGAARNYLHKWVTWAKESGISSLIQFANGLWRDQEEIIAYCRYPITTGRLEGFNNTVSRILHRACGIQDLEYLFLKCRQEAEAQRKTASPRTLFQ